MHNIRTLNLTMTLLNILLLQLLRAEDFRHYWPLQIGNNWNYRYETTKTIYALPDSVFASITLNGDRYYHWGDNREYPITIRQDERGRIYHRRSGEDVLWFDFTRKNGEQYSWWGGGFTEYIVSVYKNRTLMTYAGQFDNCIEFFFDDPATQGEERSYVFAPDIGIVKKQVALLNQLLVSAQVDRKAVVRVKRTKTNIVTGYSLSQNYPNPFNATTFIKFALPQASSVFLDIFNIRGNKIRSLVAGQQSPGEYIVLWDGMDDAGQIVSNGIYTYRLLTDDFVDIKRLVLLR